MRGFVILLMATGWASSAAAQPAPPAQWSGFYAGVGGGFAATDIQTSASTLSHGSNYFTGTDFQQVPEMARSHMTELQPAVGVQAGYSRQFGNILVGIEAGVNSLSLDKQRTITEEVQSAPGSNFAISQRVKADWQATFGGRLGWAQDRWLAYISGGVALSEVEFTLRYQDDFLTGGSGQDSTRDLRTAWTLGLGGEYAFDENWSLRASYLFADYGRSKVSARTTNAATPAAFNDLDSDVKLQTHTLLVGFAYRF